MAAGSVALLRLPQSGMGDSFQDKGKWHSTQVLQSQRKALNPHRKPRAEPRMGLPLPIRINREKSPIKNKMDKKK